MSVAKSKPRNTRPASSSSNRKTSGTVSVKVKPQVKAEEVVQRPTSVKSVPASKVSSLAEVAPVTFINRIKLSSSISVLEGEEDIFNPELNSIISDESVSEEDRVVNLVTKLTELVNGTLNKSALLTDKLARSNEIILSHQSNNNKLTNSIISLESQLKNSNEVTDNINNAYAEYKHEVTKELNRLNEVIDRNKSTNLSLNDEIRKLTAASVVKSNQVNMFRFTTIIASIVAVVAFVL